GDAMLDQRYMLDAEDPNCPRYLMGAMHAFAGCEFVHVTGAEGQITFHFSENALMMCMHQIGQILHGLASLACIFEGKPAPQILATSVAQPAQPAQLAPAGAAPPGTPQLAPGQPGMAPGQMMPQGAPPPQPGYAPQQAYGAPQQPPPGYGPPPQQPPGY